MRLADSLNTFKSQLKTHYFKLAYNLWRYTFRTPLFLFVISDLYVFIIFIYLFIFIYLNIIFIIISTVYYIYIYYFIFYLNDKIDHF